MDFSSSMVPWLQVLVVVAVVAAGVAAVKYTGKDKVSWHLALH